MLSRGNIKLGPHVWAWNLPVVKTCPGASTACLALCYAQRGRFHSPAVQAAHWRNLERAEHARFVARLTDYLAWQNIQHVRIHVSGDFYSARYVRRWLAVVQQSPHITFYAYTRSWRVPRLHKSLRALATCPNFQLWLSADSSLPRPPVWPGCRTCYLSQNDADLPPYPVDLVFRDRPQSVRKRLGGALVCPVENGVTATTCSQCQLCWHPRFKPTPPSADTPALPPSGRRG